MVKRFALVVLFALASAAAEGQTVGAAAPLLISGFASMGAQAVPLKVTAGEPVAVGWAHVAAAGTSHKFRLYVGPTLAAAVLVKEFTDAEMTVTTSETDPTSRTYVSKAGALPPFPVTFRGALVMALTAVDNGGRESARADSMVTLTVEAPTEPPPPNPPTGVTIFNIRVAVAANGDARLLSMIADAPLPPTAIRK